MPRGPCGDFSPPLGATPKTPKTQAGETLTFRGLQASFPAPLTGPRLLVGLSPDQTLLWRDRIRESPNIRAITHGDLDRLIGRLSFTRTSVFGRIGRPMFTALYQRKAPFYHLALSGREFNAIFWRRAALGHITPRLMRPRATSSNLIISTTPPHPLTRIIAAISRNPTNLRANNTLGICMSITSGAKWLARFDWRG